MRAGVLAGLAAVMGSAAVGLSGCGAASALNSGSPRVCSEAAVRKAVRVRVMPPPDQPDQFSGDMQKFVIAVNSLLPHVVLTYADTTLDGFDRDTHTATCSTLMQAKVGDQQTEPTRWTFVVQPSSEGGGIVVSSDDHTFPLALRAMLTYAAKKKTGGPF